MDSPMWPLALGLSLACWAIVVAVVLLALGEKAVMAWAERNDDEETA